MGVPAGAPGHCLNQCVAPGLRHAGAGSGDDVFYWIPACAGMTTE